jgi:hypothetical protein
MRYGDGVTKFMMRILYILCVQCILCITCILCILSILCTLGTVHTVHAVHNMQLLQFCIQFTNKKHLFLSHSLIYFHADHYVIISAVYRIVFCYCFHAFHSCTGCLLLHFYTTFYSFFSAVSFILVYVIHS